MASSRITLLPLALLAIFATVNAAGVDDTKTWWNDEGKFCTCSVTKSYPDTCIGDTYCVDEGVAVGILIAVLLGILVFAICGCVLICFCCKCCCFSKDPRSTRGVVYSSAA